MKSHFAWTLSTNRFIWLKYDVKQTGPIVMENCRTVCMLLGRLFDVDGWGTICSPRNARQVQPAELIEMFVFSSSDHVFIHAFIIHFAQPNSFVHKTDMACFLWVYTSFNHALTDCNKNVHTLKYSRSLPHSVTWRQKNMLIRMT